MPTYQYLCTACERPLEVQQRFSDDALTECPECGGRLRKVFSAVGVVFKGSGFYRNDSRAATNGSEGSGDSGSDKTSEKSADTGGDKADSGAGSGDKGGDKTGGSGSDTSGSGGGSKGGGSKGDSKGGSAPVATTSSSDPAA